MLRAEGRGAGGGRGAHLPGSGALGARGGGGGRGPPGQAGRRGTRHAAGWSTRSRGCPRLALGRAGRARGRPPRPRAGREGQHLGLPVQRPPGDSGVRRMCAHTGKRRYFVCWLPGYGEALISPPLNICNCVTC